MKPEREHTAMKTKIKHDREGRPTDYDKVVFKKKLEEYLKQKTDQLETIANKLGGFSQRLKVNLPMIESFAAFMGVTRKTLYNWEKVHPEVEEALDRIKQEQLQRLIDEGLGGNYNSTITKLLLSHNHGIKEETISEVKGEVTNKFDDRQIDRIAERIASRGRSNGNPSGKEESN